MHQALIQGVSGQPVQRITLTVDENYHFLAGQYLIVHGPGGVDIPLSIASAPEQLPQLQLHYRSTPGLAEAQAMDEALTESALQVSEAAGDVICPPQDVPLLLIAGGSGAAQAFSCARQRAGQDAPAETTILWCADDQQDLYDTDALAQLPNTTLHTVIDDRRTEENEGLIWLARNAGSFADAHIILAGGPGFVYAATDILIAQGVDESHLAADAYSYAPRDAQ